MQERLVIIGAGLCGSILAARLRNRFDVTVIERGARARPLMGELRCDTGGINTTINRGCGLGGTTNYWHNALIELADDDLAAAGLDAATMRPWYDRAWELFLDSERRATAFTILGDRSRVPEGYSGSLARMVVPQRRENLWELAGDRFPGAPVRVVTGTAQTISQRAGSLCVTVQGDGAPSDIAADRVIVAGGGLASPALLARSTGFFDQSIGGYHDHPMTYVAKIRLREGSDLGRVAGVDRAGMSLRTGFVYAHNRVKTGIYLRPAIGLGLRAITGEARYILSDLRNDPFSPRKILQLLGNPEAIREGLLFKTGAGLRGNYFSLLLLGEQYPEPDRGITVPSRGKPALNWSVSARERAAYEHAVEQFLREFAAEIAEFRVVPADKWEYRTAAHHSGGIHRFAAGDNGIFEVDALPGVFACDGSVIRAGGIANSGLTLAALALRLAEHLERAS